MACDAWTEKLDTYFDGELPPGEARAVGEHLRECPACSAEALFRVQMKRSVQAAGRKFSPDPAFRARVQKTIAPPKRSFWLQRWLPISLAAVAAALLIAGALRLTISGERNGEGQIIAQLVDQHVATLASANPVDVVSTDRHTVKPWFQGKIPFTFNLPELQDSPFTLVGGRVSYLRQSPGAELIFRIRQHQISVFIFQEQGVKEVRDNDVAQTALSFQTRSWLHNGLRYFMIGDAGAQDLEKLSELIKAAK